LNRALSVTCSVGLLALLGNLAWKFIGEVGF